MLKQRTVFVVGAGASAEFGLPVGSKLQREIAGLVNIKFEDFGSRRTSGDERVFDALNREHRQDVNAYLEAGWHIHKAVGLSHSIDNFIDSHRSNARVVVVGKIGIVRAITRAERQSKLFIDPSNTYNDLDFDSVRDTWIGRLFVSMQEGIRLEAVSNFFERAAFIIFNYDRCVEHYLLRALMAIYKLDEHEAAGVVSKAEFVHPYGTVGRLPWQPTDNRLPVAFGNLDPDLYSMARGIRTYTERVAEAAEVARIHDLVAEADTICFLGFSYQRQNMDLLTPGAEIHARLILGSAYQLSEYDIDSVCGDLNARFQLDRATVHIDNLTCAAFLQKYDRAFR